MIDRYSYPEMKALFELPSRYAHWLEVELAVCDALAELGEIPKDAAAKIRRDAKFSVERVAEIEAEVHHDMIAFIKSVTEPLGDEGKYVHLGVTSYDIEDTALGLVLRKAADLLLDDCAQLETVIIRRAREHQHTLMMGRTHGVHAEPITFGLKLCVWVEELRRNVRRLKAAQFGVAFGKISGAVGTYANVDPRVEEIVCQSLRLQPSKASTQILQRDRHAEYICALAILAGSLEKWATEIRNLQRTDLLEVEEPFAQGQRGSSAMPHKRNPIKCEQISGLARVVRGHVVPALENIVTWHERDLCNSSVERVVLADSSILLDYMLRRFTQVMAGLVVYPENMKRNLARTQGVIHSQQVMLALITKGWSREDAYTLAQSNAMQAWEEQRPFRELVAADERVKQTLTDSELDACFQFDYHLKHVNHVFEQVGL